MVYEYDDEEWENLVPPDPAWTREETDYLLDMCALYQLRFLVIADRYQVRATPIVFEFVTCVKPDHALLNVLLTYLALKSDLIFPIGASHRMTPQFIPGVGPPCSSGQLACRRLGRVVCRVTM